MPRGNIISYDEARAIGFIEPNEPRRDGAAVRFCKSKMSFSEGDEVEFEFGPYRLTRGGKRGPTARDVKLIEAVDDRRKQHVTTLFGENDIEWFGEKTHA